MKIGILGETSGRIRDAFLRRGHDAVSFDLLDTDVPGPHVKGDVLDADLTGFDLAICHPTCTYLCNSGVRWLHTEPMRWARMYAACGFFKAMLNLPVHRIAVENPVPHRYAVAEIGRLYDQTVQPWQFGDGFTKRTCWWLKNLPPLVPTNIVPGREAKCHRASPGPNRWKLRSETYPGMAEAIAEQWGSSP